MGRGREKKEAWSDSYYGAWSADAWQARGPNHGQQTGPRKPRDQRDGAAAFPSFESMSTQPKAKAHPARRSGESDDPEDLLEDKLDMVKMIQRLINGVRKAEVKLRKGSEEIEALDKKWANFQAEMKQAFVRERGRYIERVQKQKDEMEEQTQIRDEALAELQVALTADTPRQRPKVLAPAAREADAAWEELLGGEEEQDADLATALSYAFASGGCLGSTKKAEMLKLIEKHRRRGVEEGTPQRRRRRPPSTTPPRPTRSAMEGDGAAPAEAAPPETYTGAGVLLDPYQTSPSTRRSVPHSSPRSRSKTRAGIKTQGKEPVIPPTGSTSLADKLAAARKEGLSATVEVPTSDEDDLVGGLGDKAAQAPNEE
eukprot:s516_g10.t1